MPITCPSIYVARRAFNPHGLAQENNADFCEKDRNLVTQINTKLILA